MISTRTLTLLVAAAILATLGYLAHAYGLRAQAEAAGMGRDSQARDAGINQALRQAEDAIGKR